MDQNLITWNVENWITVLLMAFLGYLLVSLLAQVLLRYSGGAASGPGPSLTLATNIDLAA